MSRRRRALEEDEGVISEVKVPDEQLNNTGYVIEITFTDGVLSESKVDEAINAAVAAIELESV